MWSDNNRAWIQSLLLVGLSRKEIGILSKEIIPIQQVNVIQFKESWFQLNMEDLCTMTPFFNNCCNRRVYKLINDMLPCWSIQ